MMMMWESNELNAVVRVWCWVPNSSFPVMISTCRVAKLSNSNVRLNLCASSISSTRIMIWGVGGRGGEVLFGG